jgi:hypothetical protein
MEAPMAITRQDAIGLALERLSGAGFTMEPGFSEHGPMVAETISTLGHDAEVAPWVEAYEAKRRHIPPPPRHAAIDAGDEGQWRAALGVAARATDWFECFRRMIAETSPRDTLAAWVPVLLDGYGGGLTHGLLRTAHAVRALPEDGPPSALLLDELARGLAYWASSYHRLPDDPGARPGLPPAIASLGDATEPGAAISRHSAAFARVLLAHPALKPIPLIQLIHTVTAPVAMRNLLPYLPAERGAWAYGQLWRVSVALVARIAPDGATAAEIPAPTLAPQDLARRAIAHRDEHVIKLTEALLREDRIRPDPIYRPTAEAVLARLPPW